MKKLFSLPRSLHSQFGNIAKTLGIPRRPKHALDTRRTDRTLLKKKLVYDTIHNRRNNMVYNLRYGKRD